MLIKKGQVAVLELLVKTAKHCENKQLFVHRDSSFHSIYFAIWFANPACVLLTYPTLYSVNTLGGIIIWIRRGTHQFPGFLFSHIRMILWSGRFVWCADDNSRY